MKIIGLGANLPSRHGSPAETLKAAAQAIEQAGIKIVTASHIWKTAPVPFDPDMPWYQNAVIAVETDKSAHDLLSILLDIEQDFGRMRTRIRNTPRVLDLDLIVYDDQIIRDGPFIFLPHPRMHNRAFVLMPMAEIVTQWHHPESGEELTDLIYAIPADQRAENTNESLL
jgi:2-amino-4-hydroxy-6-hydroxymethyldihydropteridine diphosphokinase